MIEATIFDWFGVCTEKWIDVWERELQGKVDRGNLRKSFFRYLDQYANNSITGEEFLESIFRENDLSPNGYEYLLSKHGTTNVELLNLIRRLKGRYKTAILSDNFNEIVPVIEEEIGGFDKYFNVIVLSNRLNIGKTKPEIYQEVISQLGVDSKNAIFIDDKEKNLVVARSLGIRTILYQSNTQLEKELASNGVNIS